MDEILIGEKKYVSSKQAAKMTGYAKDYIGQLCREGRVPARLVGRSWYVLETAIQDHRFGDQKTEQEIQRESSIPKHSATWEAPRYEASSGEILPPVKRLRQDDAEPPFEEPTPVRADDESTLAQPLQDSWRSWFDHVGVNTESAAPVPAEDTVKEAEEPQIEAEEKEEEEEEEEIDVPIHTIYDYEQQPSEAPVPQQYVEEIPQKIDVQVSERYGGKRRSMTTAVNVVGIPLAVILAILAIVGSGYFDAYVLAFSQADMLSGVTRYSK